MKTTTFAVLILNMVATFCQKEDIEIFGRRLDSHAIKNAATIVALYIILFFIGGIAISSIEHLPLLDCLFETASAVGTVGLTLGITPTLGINWKVAPIDLPAHNLKEEIIQSPMLLS